MVSEAGGEDGAPKSGAVRTCREGEGEGRGGKDGRVKRCELWGRKGAEDTDQG